jgi:hypothetical protein
MSDIVIDAREKFLRRQIELARKTADYYEGLHDLDSAWTFRDCADKAEFELDRLTELAAREPGG